MGRALESRKPARTRIPIVVRGALYDDVANNSMPDEALLIHIVCPMVIVRVGL